MCDRFQDRPPDRLSNWGGILKGDEFKRFMMGNLGSSECQIQADGKINGGILKEMTRAYFFERTIEYVNYVNKGRSSTKKLRGG